GCDSRDPPARQGVGAVSRFPALSLTAEGDGSPLLRSVYAIRAILSESLQRSMPEPASALARSLLLGQRRGLPDEVRHDFIETGTSHLLAISGLHVAIMLGAALALGRLAFGGARWALLLALAAIWVYALVSGMSPSVTRAALMGSVFLLARALGREGSSLPALAAAAAVMTAHDPRLLGNVSFQLSFTAVAGLLLLAPPLETQLSRAAERLTGPEGAPAALGRATASALAAGIAATLGTLPLVALVFERVSYLGIPATLLALPALPLALAASAITAVAGVVWTPLGIATGWVAWAPLSYLLALVGAAARLPGGLLELGGATPAMVWGYYALLVCAAYGLRRTQGGEDGPVRGGPRVLSLGNGRLRWAALALLLACAVLWTAAVTSPDGRLTVTFLDVGQGDAIFIQTPSGKQLLIDGGPDPEVLQRELGNVMPFWDRSLDVIVLTHPDADHLNGLVSVLERYDVALVAETGVASTSAQYASWQRLLANRHDPQTLDAFAGQELRIGDGVVIRVLHPAEDVPAWTPDLRNNSGVTLRLSYGDVSFLLPADIHRYAEEALVASGASLRATVLKAAHHGSATSSSQAFLEAVQPEYVVVSAGAENKFGHPATEVVERLTAMVGEEDLYVTAEHGRVGFTTDGVRLWRDTQR
ncbi:MAG: ComEC/Rec2 family competence protein, partial [Chloroflexi bacterium]|nr:ComEC/Rec2 family competence protein [Chloroflexota bacterium]